MFGRQPVEFEIISSNKSAHFYCFVRDVKIVRMFHKSQGLLLMIICTDVNGSRLTALIYEEAEQVGHKLVNN